MKAKSLKGNSFEEIKDKITLTLEEFNPTLAIIFMPPDKGISEICELLSQKKIAIFGATGCGQFIDRDWDASTIVIMLLDLNPEFFKIEYCEMGEGGSKQSAKMIAEAGMAFCKNPAFIIASGGLKSDGDKILEGIIETAGSKAVAVGGMAADDLTRMDTLVFTTNVISRQEGALLSLIIDSDRVDIKGYATGGSQPMGIFHTVTSSEGNVVFTIDDMPALDTIMRYCGVNFEKLDNEKDLLRLSSHFQMEVHRSDKFPMSRTPMQANFEDKSVIFAGSVPQGSKVKFCTLPGLEVVENVVREFSEFRKEATQVDAMLLFSCKGREIAFGPWMGNEIEGLQQLWNTPMIGFFSFGEFGLTQEGKSEFFNVTSSIALLKEK